MNHSRSLEFADIEGEDAAEINREWNSIVESESLEVASTEYDEAAARFCKIMEIKLI